MNMFKQIGMLFTSETSAWINTLEDGDINTTVIQKYLSQYEKSLATARLMDQYVYTVSPKKYLSMAWSALFWNGKKLTKAPFIKYKKVDEENNISEEQKRLHISNNDWRMIKDFYSITEKNDMEIKLK